jgi:hypothetical protein
MKDPVTLMGNVRSVLSEDIHNKAPNSFYWKGLHFLSDSFYFYKSGKQAYDSFSYPLHPTGRRVHLLQ